jgi:hypothetical protein
MKKAFCKHFFCAVFCLIGILFFPLNRLIIALEKNRTALGLHLKRTYRASVKWLVKAGAALQFSDEEFGMAADLSKLAGASAE